MARPRFPTYEDYQRSFDKNKVTLTPEAQRKAKAMQGLVGFLGKRYKGQHIHVWVDSKVYLGLFTWGVAMHWQNGYSETRQEMSHISRSALVVNLKTGMA